MSSRAGSAGLGPGDREEISVTSANVSARQGSGLGRRIGEKYFMRVCMLAYTNYENDNRVMRYADALVSRGDHVDVVAI